MNFVEVINTTIINYTQNAFGSITDFVCIVKGEFLYATKESDKGVKTWRANVDPAKRIKELCFIAVGNLLFHTSSVTTNVSITKNTLFLWPTEISSSR